MLRSFIVSLSLSLFVVGACGGGSTPTPDTASGNKVVTVDCASVTPAATIMETDGSFNFMPSSVTITVNQAVKFITSSTHNIVPNAGNDPGLTVGFNTTACLKFTAPGTYMFHCGPHGFQGTVTVN